MTKTYTLALKLWSVHPKDLDAAGYIHKNHGGNYDNPRAAWYADQIQEYVNAAVAAVLEKAAEKFMSMCNDIKRHEKDNQFWTNGSENGQGYNSGLHSALNFLDVDEIRALIPTNALAEHDAKVRADTLREVERCLRSIIAGWKATTSGPRRKGTYPPLNEHVLESIKTLIEGEA